MKTLFIRSGSRSSSDPAGYSAGQPGWHRIEFQGNPQTWNHKINGAKFQRIDGGSPDPRWRNSPGVLWVALVPYDETLRTIFEANHNPASWGGLSSTPWYLARMQGK